jgi:hypothetical protein
MKKNIMGGIVFIILFSATLTSLTAQTSVNVENEIKLALNTWNSACKDANLEKVMAMVKQPGFLWMER